jgi:hypothetical protein
MQEQIVAAQKMSATPVRLANATELLENKVISVGSVKIRTPTRQPAPAIDSRCQGGR